MSKHPHILNAASNLLGIALVIIAGLNAGGLASKTYADQIAWVSAIFLLSSILFSYLAIRKAESEDRFESWADYAFLIGLLSLFGSVLVLAV